MQALKEDAMFMEEDLKTNISDLKYAVDSKEKENDNLKLNYKE